MVHLYRLSIKSYSFIVWLFSFFNIRAKLFLEGRRNIFQKLERSIEKSDQKVIWIHAASVGEFEQGRPLIESIRREKLNCQILLTFFSPSGYQLRKSYELADYVCYLPMDSPANARRFLDITHPDLAIFIKYEFWYDYLKTLQQKEIPTIFISCILRKNHYLFKFYSKFYHQVLRGITHYFVQDELSGQLLSGIGVDQYTISGDTRFDRVFEIAEKATDVPLIKDFVKGEKVMVIGSAWDSDLEVIKPFILEKMKKMKFIIAPHNIEEKQLTLFQGLPRSIRYSNLTEKKAGEPRILIIDNVGMLSSLYKYGQFALIGGAFNGTLHNLLEAAVYGVPVFFGKNENNKKFLEARGLTEAGGGFPFADSQELALDFAVLSRDEKRYEKAAKAAGNFVKQGTGATAMIHKMVKKYL